MKRISLPIDPFLPEVVKTLDKARALVLRAAPGAGKTTRVPAALLDAPWRREQDEILVLEPRRLAAKMAARRVAQEIGEDVGQKIGYQFRFENVSSARTRVRFLTEGMLMRRLLGDPELKGVAAVVLDEFHERHLHTDVALAFARHLQTGARPDLRVLVMSATLELEGLSKYLGDCAVMDVPGRQFDVKIEYARDAVDPRDLDYAVRDAVKESLANPIEDSAGRSDILVFLPGMAEIRRAAAALEPLRGPENLDILPLHGELSREEQDRAVEPSRNTKVILATNVAETSLTIEGVTTVIDSGFARQASYSHWSGLPALRTRKVSRASAIQRAGRAGRTAPGRCYRLFPKFDFDGRPGFDTPELARADLSQTVLELHALGVAKPEEFPWFERPQPAALEAATQLLKRLGALDASGALTRLGRKLAEFPAHPRIGRVVLESARRGVLTEGARAAALLSEGRLDGVDFVAQLARIGRFDGPMERMRERLERLGKGEHDKVNDTRPAESRMIYSLLCGFPDRVGQVREDKRAGAPGAPRGLSRFTLVLSSGGAAALSDESLARSSEYFVALDVEEKKGLGQARAELHAKLVAPIEPDWLMDLEPSAIDERVEFKWDDGRGRVDAVSRMVYDNLVLSEGPAGNAADPERMARFLVDSVLGGGSEVPEDRLTRLCDVEALKALSARLAFLAKSAPERAKGIAPPQPSELRARLAELALGKSRAEDVRESDLPAYLISLLTQEQREILESWAPGFVTLSRGRRVRVNYEEGKPPWIESRLQDFFGMTQGPKILGGSASLTLHLLAPNQRAVQVTSDLAGFWSREYPRLRSELGRRYPKHAWPENPLKPIV